MLRTLKSHCPYCGEPIRLVVDASVDSQEYTEDCEVCCRPMIVAASVYGDEIELDVRAEHE